VRVQRLERRQWLSAPLDRVFDFFAQAGNLERITPPWLHFELLGEAPAELGVGTLIDYRLHVRRIPIRWRSRIEEWEPGRSFVDRQLRGPYRLWHHRHTFTLQDGGTLVRDEVTYALPFGRAGQFAHPLFVRRDLERIFEYRHRAVQEIMA
jgi:ligand-binding SRPBCC domain-containing protein